AATRDLRYVVAGAELCRMAQARALERGVARPRGGRSCRARGARPTRLVARRRDGGGDARAAHARRRLVLSARAYPARRAVRFGHPLPSRQWRAARTLELSR